MPEIDINIIREQILALKNGLSFNDHTQWARDRIDAIAADLEKADRLAAGAQPERMPAQLDSEELLSIVESIQQDLWFDFDAQEWDPDKAWSGADMLEGIASGLTAYGLRPN